MDPEESSAPPARNQEEVVEEEDAAAAVHEEPAAPVEAAPVEEKGLAAAPAAERQGTGDEGAAAAAGGGGGGSDQAGGGVAERNREELDRVVMELSFQNEYLKSQIAASGGRERGAEEDSELVRSLKEQVERLMKEVEEHKQTQRATEAALEHVNVAYAEADAKVQDLTAKLNEDNQRTKEGYMAADPKKFPSGIKALADYVHSKGLKLGLTRTCSNTMPGSLGHEDIDAKTFASWGADYLKYDNCFTDGSSETVRGRMKVATWEGQYGNSWRTTGDINDTWASMLSNINTNDAYASYAKPRGWNDPDMLEIGNGGMTYDESVVHLSLWAIAKAPLIIGCDLRSISRETLEILSNHEVIMINQDRLGVQGKKMRTYDNEIEVWAGPLSHHRTAVLLLNRGATGSGRITAAWTDIGVRPGVAVEARDVWKHETVLGRITGGLTAEVAPHSCKLFVLTRVGRQQGGGAS